MSSPLADHISDRRAARGTRTTPTTDGHMKLASLSIIALGAGLAVAAPVVAIKTTPSEECPPPAIATVTCTTPGEDSPPKKPEKPETPKWKDGHGMPGLFTRVFAVEGDVTEVEGTGRRGVIHLQDAELRGGPKRFATLLESGYLQVKVTSRTRVVDSDGVRVALSEIDGEDALRVRGRFAPKVRWVTDDDGTVTPVLVATRVVVLDLEEPLEGE